MIHHVRLATLIATLTIAATIAACSAGGQPSPSHPGASQTPSPSPSSPRGTPAGAISADAAIARQRELDGKRITVASGYWADGSIQLLSDLLMESYPPQVSRTQSVVLQGTVPSAVLARLEHAKPGYAPITWGAVTVTGVLHAGGEHVPPTLTVEQVVAG